MKKSFALGARELALLASYGLDGKQLQDCSIRRYSFGETIIQESSPTHHIFIVINGKAKVGVTAPNGKNIILCFYVSEGLMGELELFADAEYGCSSVTSISDLSCIAIPISSNRIYLEKNLTFTKIAAAELAKKLLRSSHAVMDSTLYTAETRLCRYILAAAEHGYFRDVMTDVACSVGVSYRHLYRMLGRLCQEGILLKTKSGYQILKAEKLKTFCQ